MQLQSMLFASDAKLEAALNSDTDHIMIGANGEHIRKIQIALAAIDGVTIQADGNYGPATASAVLTYKRKRNIINRNYQKEADNIVGKMTMASLDREMIALERGRNTDQDDHICGNGYLASSAIGMSVKQQFRAQFGDLQRNPSGGAFSTIGVRGGIGNQFGIAFNSPFSHFLPLSNTQRVLATNVFGASIELTLVFLSDFRGAENRAFTLAFGPIAVINAGTFTPPDRTLIHELVHVWQAQHHPQSDAYIINSVGSQGLARAMNDTVASRDASVRTVRGFPNQFPNSPYASIPGRNFGDYAAEQIAKQVELNFASSDPKIVSQTAPIMAHVKSVAKFAKDPGNITSLKPFRIEDKRTPNVIF